MDEEFKISYYAVIPATVRYDIRLKPAEKLLYGEITSLANHMGFCFASNRYFATLYKVTTHTVSQWVSHLEKLGYIHIELIKNGKKEIQERRLFIRDAPYVQKNTYPYPLKSTYPMYKKVQYNSISINKEDLFNLIINKDSKIPKEFITVLEKLNLSYTQEMLSIFHQDKLQMIKEVIYVLFDLYKSGFDSQLLKVSRESLFSLYLISKDHNPDNFLEYYKRTIINKYSNGG